MPRTNKDDRDIQIVLTWLRKRIIAAQEIAAALGISPSTVSRNLHDENNHEFPNYEELDTLGRAFNISPRVLQIAFGLLGEDIIELLDAEEMSQYIEQGGVAPDFPTRRGAATKTKTTPKPDNGLRRRRTDATPH
jgi:transcriptional regulator with XRE-family HTH domain